MIVCECARVSNRKVRRAVARGARTVDDLAPAGGPGQECGACRPLLKRLLRGEAVTKAQARAVLEAVEDDRGRLI